VAVHILCIESSSDICGVCLTRDGEVIIEKELIGYKHSSHLLPLMIEVLEGANLSKNDLDAVALSKGPGSYPGLRVGGSTAKGWAFGLDIPLIAIDTLQALASGVEADTGDMIMPMIDARRNEVYTALYNHHLELVKEVTPLIIDEAFNEFIPTEGQLILCGNGAFKAEEYKSNRIRIEETVCSARYLSELSYNYYLEERFENLTHFEPFYLKPPKIGKPKSPLLG